MAAVLTIAKDFQLPDDFVTQPCGIIARRGGGKTYTASVLIEEMVDRLLPVVALDPLGVMWGLRAPATGRGAGLHVKILGGDHGDLPLEPTAGRVVANFIVEHPSAYVLDLSGFESNAAMDRFAGDFADALYRAQGRVRTPLHLVVDEADSFAPQRPLPAQTKMLGAFEAIVRRGRSRGLGCTLISQRPAVLNKNVLSQIEVLIVHQVTAKHDRDALDGWAQGYSTPEERAAFLAGLASLKIGEAWLWSPQWLQTFRKIQIRERRTFDSSATPKAGDTPVGPSKFATVDIDELKDAMAETVAKAEADDPKLLHARIRELEREVKGLRAETSAPPERVPYVPEGVIAGLRAGIESYDVAIATVAELRERVIDALEEVEAASVDTLPREEQPAAPAIPGRARPGRGDGSRVSRSDPASTAPRGTDRPTPPRKSVTEPTDPSRVHLRAGARRMLEAVAQWGELSKAQVATIAHVSKGGTFSTYLRDLVNAGYVHDPSGSIPSGIVEVTDLGREAAGIEPVPVDPASVLDYWRPRFRAGARRMLDVIVEHQARGVWLAREEISEQAGIAKGGTFSAYLRDLIRAGLVEEEHGVVRLQEWLR